MSWKPDVRLDGWSFLPELSECDDIRIAISVGACRNRRKITDGIDGQQTAGAHGQGADLCNQAVGFVRT